MSYHKEFAADLDRVRSTLKAVTAWSTANGRSIITCGTGTFVTDSVRVGDVAMLGGTKEVQEVTGITAASTLTGNEFFDFDTKYNSYRMWLDKGQTGTGAPASGGRILVRAPFGTTATAAAVRNAVKDAFNFHLNLSNSSDYICINVGSTGYRLNHTYLSNITNMVDGSTPTGWTFTTTVAGTDATANDGAWIVSKVISNTQVEVFGTIPFTGAFAGNIEVQRNFSSVYAVDEATPTFAGFNSAFPDLIQLRPGLGSATSFTDSFYDCYVKAIAFHSHTVNSLMTLNDHVIVGSCGDGLTLITKPDIVVGTPTTIKLISGTNLGTDLLSGTGGNFFINCHFDGSVYSTCNSFGTAWLGDTTTYCLHGQDAQIGSSFYKVLGFSISWPGTGGDLDNVISSAYFYPGIFLGSLNSMNRFFVVASANYGVSFGGDFTVSGSGHGDDIYKPHYGSFGSKLISIDPQADYAMADHAIVQNKIGQRWAGEKQYTFNPRFVTRDENGLTGVPIAGLQVDIEEIEVERFFKIVPKGVGTTYTITINGTPFSYLSGTDTTSAIITGLKTAINAGAEPVTAYSASNNGAYGPDSTHIMIIPDDEDVAFTATGDSSPTTGGVLLDTDSIRAITGSPFTTDSNGRINTSGVKLIREMAKGNFNSAQQFNARMKQRMIVSGPDTRRINQLFSIKAPFVSDINVDLASPDYEGELSS